jgi:hypothetical protein
MKLTEKSLTEIRRRAAEEGRSDLTIWDEATKGFGLRFRNNKFYWVFQYRFGDKDYRIKIGDGIRGSADKARKSAESFRGQVNDAANGRGVHPAHERDLIRAKPNPVAASFGSIIPDYLDARSKLRESSMGETKRYLEQHWKALHPTS